MAVDCLRCHASLATDARYCSACGTDQHAPGDLAATVARVEALQDLVTRTLAGRYTVRRLLGAGGMASVFLADDLTLERSVAIKVLPTEMAHDERVVARFEREAKTAAKLDHPHIIPIYRVESEGPLHYFVMKYVEGRSLDALLGAEPLPVADAVRVLGQAAAALGHAHRKGVVHRDVKPANIMLDGDDRVILTDFGISKATEATSQLTQTGVIVGTPYYMSPEQVLGRAVDGRADQYALAVVAFQLLGGRLPFDGETAQAVLYQQVHEPPAQLSTLRPDVPSHVEAAIARALSKDPGARFGTMEEFSRVVRGRLPEPASAGGRLSVSSAPPRAASTAKPAAAPTVALMGASNAAATSSPNAATVRMPSSSGHRRAPRRWLVPAGVAAAALLALVSVAAARRAHEPAPPHAAAPALDSTASAAAADTGASADTTAVASPAQSALPAPSVASPAATSPPDASPASPAVGPTRRPAREPRRHAASAPAAPNAAIAAAPATASLTVASDPYGTLYVNGTDVGVTPRADYPLAVGRQYEIRVEQDGYKPKRELITVSGPNPIRRRYILEPSSAP